MTDTRTGYHFTGDTLRDGRPIPRIGDWLEHDGPIVPCVSGLHMSEHPMDALAYAPGPMLHRVELSGEMASHGDPVDKWVGQRRRIMASIDTTDILRQFARWCALQVVDLWECPTIVREYLETGEESKRAAAGDAARAATTWAAAGAAMDDAMDTAWYAARAAAWAAAGANRYAARNAAWAAAMAAMAAGAAQRQRWATIVAEAWLADAKENE